MKNSIFIIGIIVLMACQPKASQDQIKVLDSLKTEVNVSIENLYAVDTARALNAAAKFSSDINYIKNVMQDTISRDLAFHIDAYYNYRKDFKFIGNKLERTLNELRNTKSQLQNLTHDIDNGLVENKIIDEYLKLETENVAILKGNEEKLVFYINALLPIYDSLVPRIDSLIIASKAKNDLSL